MSSPAPPRPTRRTRAAAIVVGAVLLAGVAGTRLVSAPSTPETAPDPGGPPAPAPAAPVVEPAAAASTTAAPAPVDAEVDPRAATARSLVARLAELFAPGRALTEGERREIEALEARLASLGDPAVVEIVARLDAGRDAPAGRELMFNVLRKLPGEAVERRLVSEAKRTGQPAMRTMAIESLAARPTPGALIALGDIARNDPELPARPLIAAPRDPGDTSTELPDETVFSPRMQAMSALASTHDPRAVAVLADIVTSGPDESLRMEAARNLEALNAEPRAGAVLRAAASSDPSAYVRLAALRSLQGVNDPALPGVLEAIAAGDRDAGVRLLAGRLLADVRR